VVLAEIPALRQLAERVGSSDDIFWVCLFGSSYYTQMANLDEAKDLLQRAAEVAEATRNPTFQWLVANYRCGLKMISDDVADVEAGSIEALQLGTDSDQPDAPYWFAGQLFFVREVQGRMDEILDLIHSQSEETLSSPVWQGGLALALVRDGQLAGASAHIDEFLLERGDDPFPRDAAWLITHTIFGMAVAAAGSVGQAVREYEHLIPFAGRFGTGGFTIGYPVSLTLAVLAARAGRPEQAVQHFSDALEQAERLGANIWTARTQLEWGRFLLNGGSSEAARELLVEAKRAAERMGALGIAQEAAVLLDQ
jgi:tetratricopeptide (TPR) repeat protein